MSETPAEGLQGHPHWLVALTTSKPSAGDLRLRAAFWREYLGREHANLPDDLCRSVYANCVEMLAQADRLETPPAPVVALVPKRKPAKVPAISAEQFWSQHSEAVHRIVAVHGLSWRNNVPHETVEVTLSPRLCSYVGPLGGRIRWRRDHRMPAPRYWAAGKLPDGVEALPVPERYDGPMGDMHPSLVMIRLAQSEQIATDRRLAREKRLVVDATEAAAFSASYPPMLTGPAVWQERGLVDAQAYEYCAKFRE